MTKLYRLLDASGGEFLSPTKGVLGGHRGTKRYGQMNCPAATRALKASSKEIYLRNRVFFADEATAKAAGYQPCGTCMKAEYQVWKAARPTK